MLFEGQERDEGEDERKLKTLSQDRVRFRNFIERNLIDRIL